MKATGLRLRGKMAGYEGKENEETDCCGGIFRGGADRVRLQVRKGGAAGDAGCGGAWKQGGRSGVSS